ncbi:MAG: glutamine synthetase type III, partial [Planctomycetes bacterium]|nr:glutamine synthetase type III [Planctomycetota bacterium]
LLETYVKTLGIEAQLTSNLAHQMILPAALRNQSEVAQTALVVRQATGGAAPAADGLLKELVTLTTRLREAMEALDKVREEAEGPHGDVPAHAKFHRDKVLPAMDAVRAAGDALERRVNDVLWPLPKYREMLFVY